MGGNVANVSTDGGRQALTEKNLYGTGICCMIAITNSAPMALSHYSSHNGLGDFYSGDTACQTVAPSVQHGYLHHHPDGSTNGSGGAKIYRIQQGGSKPDIYVGFAWSIPYESGVSRCKTNIATSTTGDSPFQCTHLYNDISNGGPTHHASSQAMVNGTIEISADVTNDSTSLLTIDIKYQPNAPAGDL